MKCRVIKRPVEKKMLQWSLERDGVTQSFLDRLLSCPEKARLTYVEGISPIRQNSALAFGNLFHDMLDQVYTHHTDVPSPDKIKRRLMLSEQKDRKVIGTQLAVPGALDELETNYGMAEALLNGYFIETASDWKEIDWLHLEMKFEVTYTSPSGRKFPIRGKMDGVFRDEKGGLWLFETKTKGRISEQNLLLELGHDRQVMLYLWALRAIYGETPKGVLYNVCRRPQLHRRKGESLFDFIQRINLDIKKRNDFYFKRYEIYVNKADQEAWIPEFDSMLKLVVGWSDGDYHYKNSSACDGVYGACEFLPLCGRGQTIGYMKRGVVFPELA